MCKQRGSSCNKITQVTCLHDLNNNNNGAALINCKNKNDDFRPLCGILQHHNYSSITMTADEIHEINKLKRSFQATCLMTYSRRVFTRQYTKGFHLNIFMAASLHLARLRQECSGARWMILPTYGVIAVIA